jgi:hypothetical protein
MTSVFIREMRENKRKSCIPARASASFGTRTTIIPNMTFLMTIAWSKVLEKQVTPRRAAISEWLILTDLAQPLLSL